MVRELGQPALAAAFTGHGDRRERGGAGPVPSPSGPELAPLDEVLSACVRGWTLQTVFARDLAAAHADGLLTLTGLEAPGELAGCVLGPPRDDGLIAAVEEARRFAGGFVALDGPEYLPSLHGPDAERRAADFARDLAAALRLARLRAVVNLNAAVPPSWAGDLAEGPLFAERPAPPRRTISRGSPTPCWRISCIPRQTSGACGSTGIFLSAISGPRPPVAWSESRAGAGGRGDCVRLRPPAAAPFLWRRVWTGCTPPRC